MNKVSPYHRGFSLVEMSMVLLIAGMLLASSIKVLTGQVEMQKMKTTQKILDETREALIGFAIVNGRLPRPATDALDGHESPNDCVTNEAACTGFIPWVTLGTTQVDGWRKIIRYSVTPAFSNSFEVNPTTGLSTTNPNQILKTTTATKLVQTRDGSGISLPATTAVPAVIFSHGKLNYGTRSDGSAFPSPRLTLSGVTCIDEETNDTGTANLKFPQTTNGTAGVTFITRTPAANPAAAGGEFDDQVIWISQSVLSARMNLVK
jgi:prepilin-type N-terminal cleavage/methylation domain-containing protein